MNTVRNRRRAALAACAVVWFSFAVWAAARGGLGSDKCVLCQREVPSTRWPRGCDGGGDNAACNQFEPLVTGFQLAVPILLTLVGALVVSCHSYFGGCCGNSSSGDSRAGTYRQV
jgi:hypothetical protein